MSTSSGSSVSQPQQQTQEEKTIISEIQSREAFFMLLEQNPGIIVIKLGATWCGPCKRIERAVHDFFAGAPDNVICCDIDVDYSPDFYSFLKSKKMVNGIPALLCYQKRNHTFVPNASITGTDSGKLHIFFTQCGQLRHQAMTELIP